MTQIAALGWVQQTLWLAIEIAAPAILGGLAIGILVSVFQAATQIQEQSLTFVPKIAVLMAVLMGCGSWMMTRAVDFSRHIFEALPQIAR
jgi:flagellar biosynthetic protein FliQ